MARVSVASIQKEVATLRARLVDLPAPLTAADVAAAMGIVPDPWQSDVLQSRERNVLLLCSRQSGKSTITSVLAAHQVCFTRNSLTLIVSPGRRQSGELYRKVRAAITALGAQAPPAVRENDDELELANGGRVVSLPGSEKTVRGYSAPDLVIEDEAARVDDAMFSATGPMLAVSRGRNVLLSTPFGRRGHFYEAWTNGGPSWKRITITAHQVPRIDPAWLEAERNKIGAWWFSQEYLCTFEEAESQLFHDHDIDAAFSDTIAPLWAPEAMQP
jgi:hypothetical protein